MNTTTKRWEVYDRYGNKIYITAERWEHAQQKRPWLAGYLDDVLTTIRHGRRKQDALKSRKYKYYWPWNEMFPDFNHLVVVVLFKETINKTGQVVPNNYVVNVWPVFIYGKG